METGTSIIYPHYGAGKIIDEKTVEQEGEEKEYYEVDIYLRDLTVMVPKELEAEEENNIRELVDEDTIMEELEEVRDRILDEEYEEGEIQKVQRSRLEEMEGNIKEGNLHDTMDALARLHAKFVERDMNIGEKRTYDLAKEFCKGELMGVCGYDQEEATETLSEYLPMYIPNLHDEDEEEDEEDEDEGEDGEDEENEEDDS